MDCCSSNYMDYRHSINNNFCYPYSPGMIRGASPYPMGMGPASSGSRYVGEYRGAYYDSFEKYYGYHHGQSHGSYGSHYYGNYSSYRDFPYNDYYHGSPSVSSTSHPFPGLGGYHGASHLYNRQTLPLPFQREPYFHQRDHHQYANFGNYSSNPFKGDSSGSTTNPLVNSSSSNNNNSSNNSNSSNGESPLFSTQNGYSHSAEYSAQSYGSSSPSHSHHPHPHHSVEESGGLMGSGYPSAMSNATGFTHNLKDARTRKLKERKLANKSPYCSSPSAGQNSACSSPNPGSSGSPEGSCNSNPRLKSLDSLSSDRFDQEGAIHSPTSRHPSPGRAGGIGRNVSGGSPPKRSKKQSTRQRIGGDHGREAKMGEPGGGSNCNPLTTPTIDKNVTPLPGFQQAFGSTEIGKFSEVFFNNSPGPNDLLSDNDQLPPGNHQQHHHHPHHHQLMMDSLVGCKSDVDAVSPQPWEQPTGPGDPFDSSGTGFNLQIGTSFHPSYYESSSYSSDHAVDSPLGNYFSEMTCSEYVN
ncbi:hornerin-like [Wyeomyia smithii]|uniref:hornerin-like n=1 Tax=Wyeomyia smithii TaxID=174621 RepID=UPI0024680A93|nr:hornerin-like [Wyeomyia smithii]XP_055538638.1 hornerin-like [Wyeomyia smithii]XP_055538639.1 hornerin-like [Wyeomyia smithii]XP_055538640.1 hornerin-like [Wyeomyia smithii]XP_055538642.1 hornerin-like [Wyeomyia smithii]XP_055538643.1 hornerin-like [Wyeomyia smithii]XP_055538644.1 hornerin-like [Wyeomyia smithii]XP_055538645.1 hornerin-like [Wyeomyia smithii]XP_055538646.1 hornerin-like [Wyeomyia smithii]XP_055538647.1 hornerin-like [Wyeomyia smithii]